MLDRWAGFESTGTKYFLFIMIKRPVGLAWLFWFRLVKLGSGWPGFTILVPVGQIEFRLSWPCHFGSG